MPTLQLRNHIPISGPARRERADVTETALRVSLGFERFGVHTCNWNVTPYVHELVKLPKVGYLDMGIMSDMRLVRELFPETRRAVMVSPVKFHDAPIEEIRADMRRIYDELAPCDVVMADIQAQTPNTRIIQLLEICRALERGR